MIFPFTWKKGNAGSRLDLLFCPDGLRDPLICHPISKQSNQCSETSVADVHHQRHHVS